MIEALRSAWPLFLGLGFMMLGNGLQGSLVAIRAQYEVFGNTITGVIMAGYFVGFFLGSFIVPKMLASVGHVRVFGAVASIASLGVLVYPVFVEPITWFTMRVLTGFAYAGLYIVCESWLNDRATNDNRGQLLSIYMIISLLGMAGGQFLLNLYDPSEFQLFTVVSVLVSVSVVPVLLTASKAPDFEEPEMIGPVKIYRASPLGVVAIIMVGMAAGTYIGMGPAFVLQLDLTVADSSLFMSAIFIGGLLMTWPIGRLSDKFDRRTVMLVVAIAAALASGLGMIAEEFGRISLFLVAGLMGGCAMPLYSLAIAHTNDHLTPKQMVAASSTLVMANGLGAMIGPNIAGSGMDVIGPIAFFGSLLVIHVLLAIFVIWRMGQRPSLPAEEQGDFVAMSVRAGVLAGTLNPAAEPLPEDDAPAEQENKRAGDPDETEKPA